MHHTVRYLRIDAAQSKQLDNGLGWGHVLTIAIFPASALSQDVACLSLRDT